MELIESFKRKIFPVAAYSFAVVIPKSIFKELKLEENAELILTFHYKNN